MKKTSYTSQAILSKIETQATIEHYQEIYKFYQSLLEQQKSPLTIQSYLQDILTALEFFKNYSSLPENLAAWREFFKARHHYIKPQSQRKFLASIKAFAKYLSDKTLEKILDQIALPKIPKRQPKPLTTQETKKLLESNNKNPLLETRDQAIFFLLYGCGLRISECLGLKLSDITQTEITVLGKGNKIRKVPLLPQIYEKIQAYLQLRPQSESNQLFLDTKTQPLTRQQVAKTINQLKNQLGLPAHATAHSLRHSFVSHLIENNASLKAIQNLVGHASLSTIQNYASVSINHLSKAHKLGSNTWANIKHNNKEE